MRSLLLISSLSICSIFILPSFDEGETSPYHPGIERSGGPADVLNQDRTGSPVSVGTCTACHGGGSYDPIITVSVINEEEEMVTSYTPGDDYTLEFTVSSTEGIAGGYGMQGVILNDLNGQAGTFGVPTSANSQISALALRSYIEHDGVASGGTSYTFSSPWTAPVSGTGNVTIYSIGLAVNGTGSTSGDDTTPPLEFILTEDEITTISYPGTPFCNNEDEISPIITGEDPTGVFSADAGLEINSSTGIISPIDSDFGTYTVSYTFGDPEEIVTYEVTMLETYETTAEAAICEGESIEFAGEIFTEVNEGLNIINLTAANSCDSIISLTILVNPLPEVEATVSLDTICIGESITFIGEGTATTYDWTAPIEDGIAYTPTFAGLQSFTVIGTDINSCINEDEISIFVNEVELFSIVTDVIAGGDGSIDITPSGFSPYAYDWDTDESGDFDDTQDLTSLIEGSYTVIVKDSLNCEVSETFIVDSQASIESLNELSQVLLYPNPTDDYIMIETKGSFNYSISDIKGAVIMTGNGYEISKLSLKNLDIGTYFVSITDHKNTETITLIKQ